MILTYLSNISNSNISSHTLCWQDVTPGLDISYFVDFLAHTLVERDGHFVLCPYPIQGFLDIENTDMVVYTSIRLLTTNQQQVIPSHLICMWRLNQPLSIFTVFSLNMSSMGILLHSVPDTISVETRSTHSSWLILSLPLQTK